MMSAKEAEAEWIDNRARVKSAVISKDPGKRRIETEDRKVNRECESSKFTSKTCESQTQEITEISKDWKTECE